MAEGGEECDAGIAAAVAAPSSRHEVERFRAGKAEGRCHRRRRRLLVGDDGEPSLAVAAPPDPGGAATAEVAIAVEEQPVAEFRVQRSEREREASDPALLSAEHVTGPSLDTELIVSSWPLARYAAVFL